MANQTDRYANKLYGTVTETAANTISFGEIQTNVSIFDKVAWVLHRIEWYVYAEKTVLASADDVINMALVASNSLANLLLSSPAVIDLLRIERLQFGTPANATLERQPYIRDFSGMPGGGIIVAPRPLYAAVLGESLPNPAQVALRGYFTVLQLKADEYLELVDFYRIVQ